jgi:transposase
MSCLPALPDVCPTQRLVRRDTIILSESTPIVADVDTHTDTIHVAAITMTGTEIGDREFATTEPDTPRLSDSSMRWVQSSESE